MPFKKISKGSRGGGATEPIVSMRKSGSIGFNRLTMEEFLEDAVAVELYYDEAENVLAFEPTEDADGDGYTLSRSNDTGSITPMSFFNRYQLTPDITTQYKPEVDSIESDDGEDVEVIMVDLDDSIGTYGTPKSADEESEEVEE